MGRQTTGKLNWLQVNLPDGLLVDARWLEGHGYSRSLRNKYVASGWLAQVVRGVYRRPEPASPPDRGEALPWQQLVVSLQTLLKCPFHVGGRTALELHGFAHYLPSVGLREIQLYGAGRPPSWAKKVHLDARLVFHNAAKLFAAGQRQPQAPSEPLLPYEAPLSSPGLVRHPWGESKWQIAMSSPERAILEMLDEVPRRETFHQADVMMDGLRTLRPTLLHDLLSECRSVKVKRLFLWFAERHSHPWLKRLDRSGIDLGRGKRMLVRGGRLDPKFNITVPESLDAAG